MFGYGHNSAGRNSAGAQGTAEHELAARKLELSVEIDNTTATMQSLSDRKDDLDDQYRRIEADLEASKAQPNPPPPMVPPGTKARAVYDQFKKNAEIITQRAAREERMAAEMEEIGAAKDDIDAEFEELAQELDQLHAELASLNGAGQAVAA